tara:strand:+ start:2098 stop:2859 length:762 start_codon:yes stop_codon:yes gene_type:complete
MRLKIKIFLKNKMKKEIEICAIIPARSGSKIVKNKNILKINGKYSFYYSIKAGQKSKYIQKVVFSSDSKLYLNLAKKFNPDILHLRSKKNSRAYSSDLDFLKEIYKFLKNEYNYKPDVFALLRANNPTKSLYDINSAINIFIKKYNKLSSLRSIQKMQETSYKTFIIKNKKLLGALSRSSNIDKLNYPKEKYKDTYSGNGSIDLIKTKNLEKNNLFGNKCYGYVTKHICVDIDYENDIHYADYVLKNFKNYVV